MEFFQQPSLNLADASQAHSSNEVGSGQAGSAFDTIGALTGSVQCVWASLTGTLNGQFIVEVCNEPTKTKWDPKTGASLTVTTASGHDTISLNGVMGERYYRVRWVPNGVAAGTVSAHFTAKG